MMGLDIYHKPTKKTPEALLAQRLPEFLFSVTRLWNLQGSGNAVGDMSAL